MPLHTLGLSNSFQEHDLAVCRCSHTLARPPRSVVHTQKRWRALQCAPKAFSNHFQQRTESAVGGGLVHHAASAVRSTLTAAAALSLSFLLVTGNASARWEGVNKPELLPKDFTTVIDVAGFLTNGEEQRIKTEIENLEQDKGIKLRVLAQNYPETPGLAIKDFWGVDGMTIVFVADTNTGNLLNFNVGKDVDLLMPRNFWSRLAGKYGNKFYWQDKGQGEAITNTVSAIDFCAREPMGRDQCQKIQGEMGEEPSSGKLGKFFFNS
ncbi:hypothetical protein WJX73_003143 [Symbiochloris irregularis]|uniref:TPM domain-containing protein n=1 Tax=Symbiochloris irregularis TaxID=706552 RepID=A0AAW1PC73_9CHLO